MPAVVMRYDDCDYDDDEIKSIKHLVLPPFASSSSELALNGIKWHEFASN